MYLIKCNLICVLNIKLIASNYCFSWEKLKTALIEKRNKLGESHTLQQFSRDADEFEGWICDKLQYATSTHEVRIKVYYFILQLKILGVEI